MSNTAPQSPIWTYNSRDKDGTPTYGGYSDKIVVDENYVLRMPANLPLGACAPLLCAGITLYSPLRHWQAGPGKKVAIVGLGGLGHMGVKIAHALGAEVTVLSHSPRKAGRRQAPGRRPFSCHVGPGDLQEAERQLRPDHQHRVRRAWIGTSISALLNVDGSFVVVGVPDKPVPVEAFALDLRAPQHCGSMIGGIRETQEMLDFCAQHQLTCDIEVIPIEKVNEAYERMLKSDVRYRFVIDMASLK